MAAAEAALSGGDGGRHVGAWRFPCVIASVSEAIERHGIFHDSRILCSLFATLVTLARNGTMSF